MLYKLLVLTCCTQPVEFMHKYSCKCSDTSSREYHFCRKYKKPKEVGGAQECYSKTVLSEAHCKKGMSVHGVNLHNVHMQGY